MIIIRIINRKWHDLQYTIYIKIVLLTSWENSKIEKKRYNNELFPPRKGKPMIIDPSL